tara:strand:+ start:218 stop:442 length:225 start_codon:yes stop_codon:yes gene_type:complete
MFTLPYLLIDLSFSHLTSSFHIVVEFTVTAFAPSVAVASIVVGPLSSSPAFEDGFASCLNYCIPFLGRIFSLEL